MRKFTAVLLFVIISGFSFAQFVSPEMEFAQEKLTQRGEFYFRFQCDNKDLVREMSRQLSIDKVQGTTVYAYANVQEFDVFLGYGLNFEPVYEYYNTPKALTMATTVAQMASWNRYPTHAVYLQMMQDFATNYPDLCKYEVYGYSENGVPIVGVVISDNVNTNEDEPEFWWSGTMHGDELVCYVLTLRFADYLLSNYGTNPMVTNLVDNIEIYINPLANPDGTFAGSSTLTSVSSATRSNSNSIDLNRNFPTLNGDTYTLQAESQTMIDYSATRDFVMSVNTHSGIELVNFPWDTWQTWERYNADHNWWEYVSFVYVDEVELDAPATYFEGPGSMDYPNGSTNTTGVTHGANWYYAIGSRQDYMNYYRYIQEVTIEWSDTKPLDVSLLPTYFNYNIDAMLLYTEQCLYGFRGIVTDACTGSALDDVKVEIVGHDEDNSFVFSSAPVGNYHRPIYAGTYDVTFSKTGYASKTLPVTVINNQSTRLDVELIPDGTAIPDFSASQTSLLVGESVTFTNTTTGTVTSRTWTFEGGTPASSASASPGAIIYNTAGVYDVTLSVTSNGCTVEEYKQDYITVTIPGAPVAGFSADETSSCNGVIQFTNSSVDADSYLWDFGDGETSTDENPQHIYTVNDTYTVVLIATNAYGDNTMTRTDYIVVDRPEAPITTGVEACGTALLTLTASGLGNLVWYSTATGGSEIATGTSFTNTFSETTNLYVQSGIEPEYFSGGNSDINTNGGNHTSNTYYLIFTANEDFKLLSVQVNSSTTGNRIIQLRNSSNVEIASKTVYLTTGINTVSLDFDIPAGTNYQLKCGTSTPNLYRNNSGVSWPYLIGDAVSITGTNAGDAAFYYYFYNWEIMTGDECISARTPVTATINPTPTDVTVTGGVTQCGGTATLNATGGTGGIIYWQNTTSNGTSTATPSSSQTVSTSGTYYFRALAGTSCWGNQGSATVTINPVPTAVTVSGGGTQCGGSMMLTTTGGTGGTIYWQGTTSGGTSTTTASTSQSVSASGTYYFRSMSAAGCWGQEGSATVTINAAPGDVAVTGGVTQCGGTATLNATGGTGGTIYWQNTTNNGTSTATTSTSQTVSATGTYYFRAQSAQGCWGNQGSATVTINAVPTAVAVSGGGTQCGGSMMLTATDGTGGTIYWQGTTSGGTSTTTASTSQSVSASGTYYFRSMSAAGCWGQEGSATVTINAAPGDVAVTGGVTQCGGTATLNATGGTGGTIYWQNTTNNGTSTATASASQTVSATGTYYFRAQSAQGCWGNQGSASVTINPAVNASVLTTPESAPGANDGTATASASAGTAPYSFTWQLPYTGNPLTGLAGGTYCVTVQDFNNCTASACGTVSTNGAAPVANIDTDVTAGCDNLTVAFTDISSNFPTSWEWNFGDGSPTSLDNNPIHTYSGQGFYNVSLTVTNANGSDELILENYIHVGETPTLELSMTQETLAGNDGSATVVADGGSSPYQWEWSNGSYNSTITGLTAGEYCVTVTETGNNCQATACIDVTQEGLTAPFADFGADDTEACLSLTVNFTDLSTNNPTEWLWDFGDGASSTEQNSVHTYSTIGIYTVSLTATNAVGSDEEIKTDYISVFAKPVLSFEVTNESATGMNDGSIELTITGGADPYTVNWSNDAHTLIISDLAAGIFSVAVIDDNGCMSTGLAEVQVSSAIAENAENTIKVFPNPSQGDFTVEAEEPIVSVEIIDATGRTCSFISSDCDKLKISENLVSGVYLVIVKTKSDSGLFRMIVQ